MRTYRVGRGAELIGVSADPVRGWVDDGRFGPSQREGGERLVEGVALAKFLTETAPAGDEPPVLESARNRFPGIVTRVEKDGLVAVVHIQAGPHPVTSMMTAEAGGELGARPGARAGAGVKAEDAG